MLKRYLRCVLNVKMPLSFYLPFPASMNTFTWRSHTCAELSAEHVGQEVTICGWTAFHRCDKFILLHDTYGETQVIFRENDNLSKTFLQSLPLESVVQVKGVVKRRPPKDENNKLPTGKIEVEASEIKLLNSSLPKLPIKTKDYQKVTDTTKLKYRYLSLRIPEIQENLKLRSKVLMKMREFLHYKHGFVDVETPTLFRRTPGGAKEFIVPTKFPGNFYSLTQSPQQFKQMLMVGGIDRYFQIARCYRNEGTKADRQPEFTQLDIELSFTTPRDIMNLIELLLKYSWPAEKTEITIPFPQMTHAEAIRTYGSDKPDLRYELKIHDLSDDLKNSGLKIVERANTNPTFCISCIVLPNGSKHIKPSFIKDLQKEANIQSLNFFPVTIKDDFSWVSAVSKHISEETKQVINSKFCLKPGDMILITAGQEKVVHLFLGKSRTSCAECMQLAGVDLIRTNSYYFVWVTDFPLFEHEKNGNLQSAHHPFTAPHPDDVDLVFTDPIHARSQHYDLVLNGQEIGGGSIRIHDSFLQKYILEQILGEDSNNMKYFLDALSSGCPPHGGIAIGIDRLLSVICGSRTIADVIAFPKSLDGKDLMSGAPSPISNEDKDLYHVEPVMPIFSKT